MKKLVLSLIFFLSFLFHFKGFSTEIQYGVYSQKELGALFAQAIPCKISSDNLIGYIYFSKEHPIDEATYYYVKAALDLFKEKKVCFVVVHLNTFGGAVFPAIKIADLFQKFDINYQIPLIAYIDQYAIGSGTMLAYACRFIAVTQDSYMGGQLPSQKINLQSTPDSLMPYVLNEYSSLANLYGRDPVIAEAMADIKMIVVERNGKLIGLYNRLDIKPETDVILATDRQWLSLDAASLLKFGIANFQVDKSLTKFRTGEAFSNIPLSSEPFLSKFSQAKLIVFSSVIIETLLFLTKPFFAAILLFFVIVTLYLQIKQPYFHMWSIGLFLGVILMFFSSLGIQSTSWVELLFLILGLVIIFLDIFLTEGSTLICFFGFVLVVFSLFMMMLPGFEKFSLLDFEAFSFAAGSLYQRVVFLISSVLLALLTILFLEKKYFAVKVKGEEFSTHRNEPLDHSKEEQNEMVGRIGIAYTTLKPDGKVMIDDKLFEAIAFDQKMILKKSRVSVVSYQDGKVIVKEI